MPWQGSDQRGKRQPKRKEKDVDYRNKAKILSVVKTWIIVALLVVIASAGTFLVMTWQFSDRTQNSLSKALDVIDGNMTNFTTHYNTIDETLQNMNGDIADLEIVINQVSNIGVWDVMTATGYTSRDEGVNNISSIGMDIAQWSSYMNFCAINTDGPIDYGDTVIVKMPDGTLKSFIAVDTGGGLEVDQIDLYFGYNLEEAFNFGRQRLEVWVLK